MQQYMDDIQDILDGLETEMSRRLKRVGKWDSQIVELQKTSKELEKCVFDESIPQDKRSKKVFELANVRGQIRALTERKATLCEKNQRTVDAVYKKMSELAYHCKCEVEIDNPGCTEQREQLFCRTVGFAQLEADHEDGRIQISSNLPSGQRTREMSFMSEEGNASRSEITREKKQGVGRPRKYHKDSLFNGKGSGLSSARSSIEREVGKNGKNGEKISKYMRKKQEKIREQQRLDELQRMKMMEREKSRMSVKKEVNEGDGFSDWRIMNTVPEEDEQELLDFLLPGIDCLPSPPRGIMESLDVSDAGMFSVEPYRTSTDQHKVIDEYPHYGETPYPSSSSTSYKRQNAGPTISDHSEKRTRNMFGSVADTSFSGRQRKMTDRALNMVSFHRQREERKRRRENDEWCFCSGNDDSEQMVACDNKNCQVVWFHFECVGLKEEPKNDWFCRDCSRIPPELRSVVPRND